MTMQNTQVSDQATEDSNPYVINSALRTLQVLRSFAQPPHQFSLSELVSLLNIEKNQLYRSLKTLEKADFISSQEDGRFSLTSIIHDLSAASVQLSEQSLVEIAQRYLDDCVKQTRESVNLFIRMGDHAVCVDRRDSPEPVKLTSVLGMSVSLHAGAVPKAMLAHVDEDTQRRVLASLPNLPRYTAKTVLKPELLGQELGHIREQGYAVSDEDFDASARGVGAAIFDAKHEVVAGISVGGPSFRVDDAALASYGQLISQLALMISRRLGYHESS
jgi:IclR family acetate operon transcriptional repressor